MITTDDYQKLAECCYLMGLATNNTKWDKLAERWLRRAGSRRGALQQLFAVRELSAGRQSAHADCLEPSNHSRHFVGCSG